MDFYTRHSAADRANLPFFILERHIHGIDLDEGAVSTTSAILVLKALQHASCSFRKSLRLNIRQGDFLFPNATEDKEQMHFGMILGNPPHGAHLDEAQRQIVRDNYETWKSRDSSSLFVEKAIKALEYGGMLGFVVPKSLSYVVSWRPIREYLLKQCRLMEIVDVGKAFKDVRLEQIAIVAQKSKKTCKSTLVTIMDEKVSPSSHGIDSSALTGAGFSIWLKSRRIKSIVEKLWEHSVPLVNIAEIRSGLNMRRIPPPQKGEPYRSYPCLRGKDIMRYNIKLDEVSQIGITDALERRIPTVAALLRPKIVAQDIVAHIYHPRPHIKIIAAIDEGGKLLCANTVTNIMSQDYSLKYLCGIINSGLVSWYAHDFIYNRAARTMHFREGYASRIPIPVISPDSSDRKMTHDRIVDCVKLLTQTNIKQPTDDEVKALERKVEELVCMLYGIDQEDFEFLNRYAGVFSCY